MEDSAGFALAVTAQALIHGRVGFYFMGLEASANEHGPAFGPSAALKMEGPRALAHLLEQ